MVDIAIKANQTRPNKDSQGRILIFTHTIWLYGETSISYTIPGGLPTLAVSSHTLLLRVVFSLIIIIMIVTPFRVLYTGVSRWFLSGF